MGRVSDALIPRGGPPNFGDLQTPARYGKLFFFPQFMLPIGEIKAAILHGEQVIREANFYSVDHDRLPGQK